MKYVKTETKKEEKEKFDLQECFTLWRNTSKEGNVYLSGYDFNKNRIIGFYNKKLSDKQPSIRVFGVDEEGKTTKEEIGLLMTKIPENIETYDYPSNTENVEDNDADMSKEENND